MAQSTLLRRRGGEGGMALQLSLREESGRNKGARGVNKAKAQKGLQVPGEDGSVGWWWGYE